MKREYVFSVILSDEEYTNLKRVGEILSTSDEFKIAVAMYPDDLIPESLQDNLRTHIVRCVKSLYELRLGNRRTH
jgi:hypothetical protein